MDVSVDKEEISPDELQFHSPIIGPIANEKGSAMNNNHPTRTPQLGKWFSFLVAGFLAASLPLHVFAAPGGGMRGGGGSLQGGGSPNGNWQNNNQGTGQAFQENGQGHSPPPPPRQGMQNDDSEGITGMQTPPGRRRHSHKGRYDQAMQQMNGQSSSSSGQGSNNFAPPPPPPDDNFTE